MQAADDNPGAAVRPGPGAMLIGELATADDPSLVTSFGTTELLSNGNQSSRNQWHFLQLRLNSAY